MKTEINLQKTTTFNPGWIIELVKKQHPERTDIISALNYCTICRWESPAYVYFNEGLPLRGGAMLRDKINGLIIIDMTECGKVAGIEFYDKVPEPQGEQAVTVTGSGSETPADLRTHYNSAGWPFWIPKK